MLRNYLKIAYRNLLKNKAYAIINITGIGIALACSMAAYLFVGFNIEFDDFYSSQKTDDLFKVYQTLEREDGTPYYQLFAPAAMAPIATEEVAGIKSFTRFSGDGGALSIGDQAFNQGIQFADSTFLELFKIRLKYGSATGFKDLTSVFLSLETSEKFFKDENPVGKQMKVSIRGKDFDVIVGGVFEKIPVNSSFNIQCLMRYEHFLTIYDLEPGNWGDWHDAATIFQLVDPTQARHIAAQLLKYVSIRNEAKPDTKSVNFALRPFMEKISQDEVNGSMMNLPISIVPLLVFVTLALIILLIALFNLTNTTIALTSKRLKEVGIRKVVGSLRRQLVFQYLIEMLMIISMALVFGLGVSLIIVPEFAAMWANVGFTMTDLSAMNTFIMLIMVVFASALIAGSYPALYNSKFNPSTLLKGNVQLKGTNTLTQTLLVLQFALSVVVLVAGTIFTQNSWYQKRVDFGYDLSKILTVRISDATEYERLEAALRANPDIESIAVTDHHIGYGGYNNPININGGEDVGTIVYEVGPNYFNVMGFEIIEGRNFIKDNVSDQLESCIVDQQFLEAHQITDALGTTIRHQGVNYQVIGVVGNHVDNLFYSPGVEIGHFYRVAKPVQYHVLIAFVPSGPTKEVFDEVEKAWKDLYPEKPFQGRSQEDIVLGESTNVSRNLTRIFFFLTILGLLLSASGVYALASLNIEKRTKEIGIRKVLGATISNILRLINKEFVIIMAVAVVIGCAVGYTLTTALLDEIYIQHIDVRWSVVIACGLLVALIGISTTSITIFRAANANPSSTLRSE